MPGDTVRIQINQKQMAHVIDALAQLPDGMRRTALKSASTKSMALVRKEARSNVGQGPYSVGLLKKAIKTVTRSYGKSGVVFSMLAIDGTIEGIDPDGRKRRPIKYAHLVEFGTRAHSLKMAKNRDALSRNTHPGTKPRPFMRKAFDAKNESMQKVFSDSIGKWLSKKASQLASKAPK